MLRNCGVGWGGVGLMTFFGLAHMVDATQLLGWGGVGWGWWHSLNLHTWWMLRNCWGGVGGQSCFGKLVQWNSHTQPTRCIWLPEARLANRRCRKRIEAWGSRRKDCMIWAVPRKKGSECGTGKGQGCSVHVLHYYIYIMLWLPSFFLSFVHFGHCRFAFTFQACLGGCTTMRQQYAVCSFTWGNTCLLVRYWKRLLWLTMPQRHLWLKNYRRFRAAASSRFWGHTSRLCSPKSCLCHHWSDQIWKLQVREDQIEIDWRGLQRALVLDKIDCCPVTMKARRFLWPDDCKANWRQWLCSLTPFFMFCFILVMCILDGWFDWFVIHVSNSSWS